MNYKSTETYERKKEKFPMPIALSLSRYSTSFVLPPSLLNYP